MQLILLCLLRKGNLDSLRLLLLLFFQWNPNLASGQDVWYFVWSLGSIEIGILGMSHC